MKRADWWEEVTDPEFVIEEGRLIRLEQPGRSSEFNTEVDEVRKHFVENSRVFIDKTWNPPIDWKDRINTQVTAKEAEALPIGTILSGPHYVKVEQNVWKHKLDDSTYSNSVMHGDYLLEVGEG